MLTDLEFRVWTQYLLSADDFGVMRCSAVTLQADNDHLANRKPKQLDRCLESLVKSGLVKDFTHQKRRYVFQHDWQKWQKVEYPRGTTNPQPTPDALGLCDAVTRELFGKHPGGQRRIKPKDAPSDSERAPQTHPEHVPKDLEQSATTRARARETATANGQRLTPTANGEAMDVAFVRFRDAYPASRRKGGWHVQTRFIDEAEKAGSANALMLALENHLASDQWADAKLIPGMDTWLEEERWRQTLPAKSATKGASNVERWKELEQARKAGTR